MPPLHVAVLCPSRGLIATRALAALLADLADAAVEHALVLVDGLPMPDCRHECWRRLLAMEAERGRRFDFVLWWDDDQAPRPGTLRRYLEVIERPRAAMVTGQTFVRRGERVLRAVTPMKPGAARVRRATGAGLFYALVRRHVFDVFDPVRLMTGSTGEDWQLTTAMHARGFHILLLNDVVVPHLELVRVHDKSQGWNGCHVVREVEAIEDI